MTIAKRSAQILALAAAIFTASTTVNAADLSYGEPVESPAVHGSLTAYGWYVFPGGDITIGDTSIDIGDGNSDTSLFDILDGFFMANGELTYAGFGVYGDVLYASLSNDYANSGWELDTLVVTGLLTYDLMRSSSGYVQVGAGVRYWAVDTSIYVLNATASRSPDWVDFVGGLRGQQYLSDAIYIEGTALAGFGGSEFMWDVYGGLGYNFTSNFSGSIGYRGLGVNYSTGPTELDLTMHGPVAGLTLRF
jgi:opacity protein-like surface antigen